MYRRYARLAIVWRIFSIPWLGIECVRCCRYDFFIGAWSSLQPCEQPQTAMPMAIEDTGWRFLCFGGLIKRASRQLRQSGETWDSILGSISCLTRDTLAVRGYKNTDTPKPPFYLGFLPSVNSGLPIHIGRSAISSVSFAWLKIFNPMIPL
ncbi:hypothetical protein E4T52_09362 [Aureobasidium sp. EXF-3400]|nr:hypothetical protein E4T51_09704 [Aureobasidium sp. EXF-12344]KAI4775698.1 hypothetical protein E4T52_09362 [Aureobasidium sp. EXF-3400]